MKHVVQWTLVFAAVLGIPTLLVGLSDTGEHLPNPGPVFVSLLAADLLAVGFFAALFLRLAGLARPPNWRRIALYPLAALFSYLTFVGAIVGTHWLEMLETVRAPILILLGILWLAPHAVVRFPIAILLPGLVGYALTFSMYRTAQWVLPWAQTVLPDRVGSADFFNAGLTSLLAAFMGTIFGWFLAFEFVLRTPDHACMSEPLAEEQGYEHGA